MSKTTWDLRNILRRTLRDSGFRVETDSRFERVGKIAGAEVQKIPYMLIVGKRDMESSSVSVRKRGEGDLGAMPLDELLGILCNETDEGRDRSGAARDSVQS